MRIHEYTEHCFSFSEITKKNNWESENPCFFRRNWSAYMVGFFLSRLVSWSLSKFDQVLGPENFENHLNETTLKLVIMFNLSVNRIVFPAFEIRGIWGWFVHRWCLGSFRFSWKKWVCLKIGYIPNYSHLVGIMIINHWV